MKTDVLKQTELFVLLAMILLLLTVPFRNNYPKVPPVINLSEEDENFRFASGSATISPDYGRKLLVDVIPKIDSLSKQYDCNAIQVIGYTSGFPVRNTDSSNIDELLVYSIYHHKIHHTRELLKANSNADLGIMRAVAVIQYFRFYKHFGGSFFSPKNSGEKETTWKDTLSQKLQLNSPLVLNDSLPPLGEIEYFFPLSAAQLILEDGHLVDSLHIEKDLELNLPSRRRIEIRLLRYEPPN